MNFEITDERRMFCQLATQISGDFDDAYWQAIDAESTFPRRFWDVLVAQGIAGMNVPEAYGGAGRGMLDVAMVSEALAAGGAGMDGGGLLVSGAVFGTHVLGEHAHPDLRARHLPGVVKGELWAGAFTEADSGSDITSVALRADLRDGVYTLTGQKMFISMVQEAQHIVLLARTSPRDSSRPTDGLSLMVADLPNPSIQATAFSKLGCHFMDTNAVYVDGLEVPAENVIGAPGRALHALYDVLNAERIVLAAVAVGTGELALRRAVEFAMERVVWNGKPIASHQGVQFPLAAAKMRLSAARLAVYEAAWLYDEGSRRTGDVATMARYLATHAALEAADQAIQTFGGAGYIRESGVERHWRNLRLGRLAPISDELALSHVARHVLGMPRSY